MNPLLIAGLGNPGPEYRATWHNLGYRVVEKIAAEMNVDFIAGKGEFLYTRKSIGGKDIVLFKPTSFMNLSGRPILKIVEDEDFYHENVMVICDDINLPLSRIRMRGRGSDGGHKGLASVIYYLGTDNFPRLRMGIACSDRIDNLKDYVLSEIPQKLAETVDNMLQSTVEAVLCFLNEGLNTAMSKFNSAEAADLQQTSS